MVIRNIIIPVVAAAGVAFAVYTAKSSNRPVEPAQPVAPPAKSPYEQPIAGAGLVESSTQNIAIGTNLPGIVTKVFVKGGDKAKAGDPLFTLDDRSQRAEVLVRESSLLVARAAEMIAAENLGKLRALPRKEELPPMEARVSEMEAMLSDLRAQLGNIESVTDARAVAREDIDKRRFAVQAAQARLVESKTQLELMRAGAWKPDLAIQQSQVDSAKAQVQAAMAQVESARTDLDRLTVKAPVDGTVLQVNIRAGEFAQAGPLTTPLMLFGNTDVLHVRVDIDENDAWKIKPGAKASANLRGNSALRTELTFVRIEPFVVPKRSLTGDSSERVDTRVLQVLYAFKDPAFAVYVGQQMDIYVEGAQTK